LVIEEDEILNSFLLNGQLYRQKFGAAMGSPVSSVVAYICVEHLEQTYDITTAPLDFKPSRWKR
jgi:hypothetical protein